MLLAVVLAQHTPPPTPPPLVPEWEVPVETPLPSPVPAQSPAAVKPSGGKLTVSSASLNLNPAQQRIITISGAVAPVQATLDQRLVTASVDDNGTSVTLVAAQATGSDVLHLVDAVGTRADVPIRVAFNAGTIVPTTTLRVTGNALDQNWIARQVQGWVAAVTSVQPGLRASVGRAVPSKSPAPGALASFAVPVRIAGNGRYFDAVGSTTVDVQNAGLAAFSPQVLLYDDDPELVTQDGVLFRGSVAAGQAARLYYYHNNDATRRRIVILFANASEDPTSLQIVDALAGPGTDVLDVGNDLTRTFLMAKARNQGVAVDLPQGRPWIFKDVMMSGGDDLAGAIDLQPVSGGPVQVTVVAVSPGIDPLSVATRPLLDDDGHGRHGTFVLTGYGRDALEYVTGSQDDASLMLGQSGPPASTGAHDTGHDWGDYGVTHTIDVTLANPNGVSSTAYLYFKPLGGTARASFLIDGNVFEIGCVRKPVAYQIASFEVAPQQTLHRTVTTMADGGSSYPVEIGVTGTPPQPANPALHSGEGCFPTSDTGRRDFRR